MDTTIRDAGDLFRLESYERVMKRLQQLIEAGVKPGSGRRTEVAAVLERFANEPRAKGNLLDELNELYRELGDLLEEIYKTKRDDWSDSPLALAMRNSTLVIRIVRDNLSRWHDGSWRTLSLTNDGLLNSLQAVALDMSGHAPRSPTVPSRVDEFVEDMTGDLRLLGGALVLLRFVARQPNCFGDSHEAN